MHNMCIWATKQKTTPEKVSFYDEMVSEWDFGSSSEIIVSLEDFNGHMEGNVLRVLKVYTRGMVLGKEKQKEGDCWSFVMKQNCAWQTLGFTRQTKRKSPIVPMDVKQKLILCLWEKNAESM